MNHLKQIHAHTLRTNIDFTKFIITKLLEIPNITYAHKVFDLIPQPSVFLYNKLIQAYSSHGPYHSCFTLYTQMCIKGCCPNQYTFTSLFAVSATLCLPDHGRTLHAHLVKLGYEFDLYASTALVGMYAKLGLLVCARRVFDKMMIRDVPTWNSLIAGYARNGDMEGAAKLFYEMPVKNVISWTAMISGYSQNGKYGNSLKLFLKMEKLKHLQPNEVTITSVLPACSSLGALEVGQRIETYARNRGYFKNLFVCNALLEMYAKCGKIDKAMAIFEEINESRNLCSWNTMIMGLAVHGKSNEALNLFHKMLSEGKPPDDVTFVGAILACSHGGMVKKGKEIFELMENKLSITPKLEHYGCMIDLLGRAGQLQEAYNIIQTMPMKPDSVAWGTLLGACSFYNNVELAEKAAEHLYELEPWNPGNYVILSNIYANTGRWDRVAKLRKTMKGSQITKAAGYSFFEEGSEVYKFIVDDKSHPRSDEIYWTLNEISSKMKKPHEDDATIFECFS
ncbi:pentatricopeptide repeat-containing protein At5g08510-like [Bidens hawaiensis]|uniref:pentatricopeptide repeat-containing protein At5g08510-like n=1 Tax=Bidens hawaiensis TaxID=980011 RepID=UPI0040494621